MHIVDDANNNNNNKIRKKKIKTIHSTSDISASNDQELLGNITAPNEITETNVLTKREEKIKAPLLSKYHYRVIDIKNSKLHMNTDNETIRNTQNIDCAFPKFLILNLSLSNLSFIFSSVLFLLSLKTYKKNIFKK